MSKVAVAQMNSSDNLIENLETVAKLCQSAEESQANMLVLPENFAFMGKDELAKHAIAETEGEGEIQATLSKLAKAHKLWIIAGTVPLKATEEKVWAACLVYNSEGVEVARYDKIHLFDVEVSASEKYLESASYCPGKSLKVVETPCGTVGLSTCYDVRFPEMYRMLQKEGATLFTVVAAFTEATGKAHWHTLLKARAIENMCYVIGSNQVGMHASGRRTYGHSIIISPWGEVLAEASAEDELIYAEIDLAALYEQRKQFPVLNHQVL